jgi:hypothetical protein
LLLSFLYLNMFFNSSVKYVPCLISHSFSPFVGAHLFIKNTV